MHPTLKDWLKIFDDKCHTEAKHPTLLYGALVLMGAITPYSGICACDEVIVSEVKAIQSPLCGQTPCPISCNSDDLVKHRDIINLYTSWHALHGAYNRRVHESMMSRGLLAVVRQVCLRDLRGQLVRKTNPNKAPIHSPAKPITNEGYGTLLATFLVEKPVGWF